MPLTAHHADLGLLDVTQPELGASIEWSRIHRVKPAPPLSCRACGGAMVAKNSSRENPFFAHHRRPEDCWLAGESIHHRLLKVTLASAIRDAGWDAELEAAGSGITPWRADVLATAPDRTRRIAFEAQLAAIDDAEITRRTQNYSASDVGVCWVTDKPREWLGAAPYVMVRPGDTNYIVELGLWKFAPSWCEDRARCEHQLYESSFVFRNLNPSSGPLPCPGHGSWIPVLLPLSDVVGFILNGQVSDVVTTDHIGIGSGPRAWWSRDEHHVWTAPHYARLRAEQADAERRYRLAQDVQAAQARRREAHIEALAARQTALRWPACEALGVRHGTAATIMRSDPPWDEHWAMAVPVVSVNNRNNVLGVVCPVASRITPSLARKLLHVVIVVASEKERARIATQCQPGQEFLVIATPGRN